MQNPRLKLFVLEFITAGGLSDTALPETLLKEGVMMRDALLQDLVKLDQFSLITMHDARIAPNAMVEQSLAVFPNSFESTFKRVLKQVDLVWIIAPESDGILQQLQQHCLDEQRLFLGCGAHAIKHTSNKLLCTDLLAKANILHIPSFTFEAWRNRHDVRQDALFSKIGQQWVVKPIDGVGCDRVRLFEHDLAVDAWLHQAKMPQQYLIQPYYQGVPASIAMLCVNGKGWLLSCNQQHIQEQGDALALTGITINGLSQYWTQLQVLCDAVAQMLPDAKGYIGVDAIIDVEHHTITVVEINPRLTTSYVALSQATACNVAELVVDCILNEAFNMPTIEKNKVKINL